MFITNSYECKLFLDIQGIIYVPVLQVLMTFAVEHSFPVRCLLKKGEVLMVQMTGEQLMYHADQAVLNVGHVVFLILNT